MKRYTILLFFLAVMVACETTKKKNTSASSETLAETLKVKPDLVEKEVDYKNAEVTMKGYVVYDKNLSIKRPGILVFHEWWGHNDYTRKRAQMLAELGYVAMAVDMYGDGATASHPDEASNFTQQVTSDMDVAIQRFESALNTLRNNKMVDTSKIGAVGYCFGGTMVLSFANLKKYNLGAVAAFHAGLRLPIMPASQPQTKFFIANGEDDPFVSKQHIEDFKDVMDAVNADYKFVSYPGAVHAFTNPDANSMGEKFNLPLAYNHKADSSSWEEMKLLFKEVFQP